jgi:restriction system protein
VSKYTVFSFIRDIDRASRSAAYHQRVAASRAEREYQRSLATQRRAQKTAAVEQKARYLADRTEEVAERNRSVADRLTELESVLQQTLSVNDRIDFDSLLTREDYQPFRPPKDVAAPAPPPQQRVADLHIAPLNFVARLFKSKRVERQTALQERQQAEYDAAFAADTARYEREELARRQRLSELLSEYERDRETFLLKVAEENEGITKFKAAYLDGDAEAIEAYCGLVLDRSEYPDGFPDEHTVDYKKGSRRLIVRMQVPSASLIPEIAEYRYVKSSDTVSEKRRSATETKRLHVALLAQIALRSVHEQFEADQRDWIDTVRFAGYLKAIDAVRGGAWRPTVIQFVIQKSEFVPIRLGQVNATLCAKDLGARFAKALDGTASLE